MVRPTCPDYSLSVWLIIHVASGDLAKSFFAFPPTKGYFHTSTLQSVVIKLTVGVFFPRRELNSGNGFKQSDAIWLWCDSHPTLKPVDSLLENFVTAWIYTLNLHPVHIWSIQRRQQLCEKLPSQIGSENAIHTFKAPKTVLFPLPLNLFMPPVTR